MLSGETWKSLPSLRLFSRRRLLRQLSPPAPPLKFVGQRDLGERVDPAMADLVLAEPRLRGGRGGGRVKQASNAPELMITWATPLTFPEIPKGLLAAIRHSSPSV